MSLSLSSSSPARRRHSTIGRKLEPCATLWYGPMSSGKSDKLHIQMEVFTKANYKCVLIKYAKDTRYTDGEKQDICISKSGIVCDKNVINVEKNELMEIVNDKENRHHKKVFEADCIGIDEVQFFNYAVEFVTTLVLREKKCVYMAGLDTNFRNDPWDYLPRMIAICTHSEKCLGVCSNCGSLYGSTTMRIDQDDVSEEKIGDDYVTLCIHCFFEKSKHKAAHFKHLELSKKEE